MSELDDLVKEYGVNNDPKPAGGRSRRRMLVAIAVVALAVVGGGVVWNQTANGDEPAAEAGENADAEGQTADQKKGDESADEPADKDAADPAAKAAVPVKVITAATGPIAAYMSATANLVSEQEVHVLAEAEGRVQSLLVEEGDVVRRGQVLAQLVKDDASIAVQKAELRADGTRLAHGRAQLSMSNELLSREAFDKVSTEHRLAEQELAEAKLRLDKTAIRAPFDGVVAGRTISLGQHVRPGDAAFVVTDRDPLVARIFVPEREVAFLTVGTLAKLTLEARPDVALEGRIRQISPVVDVATGTVKVTVEAVSPPAEVRPGAFVTVAIVRERNAVAVLVPKTAVLREMSAAHVFVEESGVAKRRPVTLGLEEGDQIEIASGLPAGSRVITAGQGSLKDGAAVKVIDPPVAQAAQTDDVPVATPVAAG